MKGNKQKGDHSEAVAHHEALSDALFLSIGEGAIATDEDGHISRINQAALNMLGFTRKELVGKWFPSALVATDEAGKPVPTIDRPITKSFLAGRAVSAQCFYRKKDGTLLPVAVTTSPIMLDERPVGAIEVFRDITEELEIDRMKSEFISLASHQLRTPATAVKTYLALLKDGFAGDLTDEQQRFADIAYKSNERQLQIVNDLLMVANTESRTFKLKKEKVDLRELINEVVEQQLGVIKKRSQKLRVTLPKHGATHKIDPSFFKMVVDNLLSNASKYTPENGDIAIRLTCKKDEFELSVSDTGVGIDPSDMEKLFRKFTRIDNPLSIKAGGSGIGLYLLKQIVDLHEGKITVKSAKGEGTTFKVTFPLQLGASKQGSS